MTTLESGGDRTNHPLESLKDKVDRMVEGLTRLKNVLAENLQDMREEAKKRDGQIDRLERAVSLAVESTSQL